MQSIIAKIRKNIHQRIIKYWGINVHCKCDTQVPKVEKWVFHEKGSSNAVLKWRQSITVFVCDLKPKWKMYLFPLTQLTLKNSHGPKYFIAIVTVHFKIRVKIECLILDNKHMRVSSHIHRNSYLPTSNRLILWTNIVYIRLILWTSILVICFILWTNILENVWSCGPTY